MEPELKAKWVKALKSGEYAQGRRYLYAPHRNNYCCLGVLCAVAAVAPEDWHDRSWGPFNDDDGFLGLPKGEAENLSMMNDGGTPFAEIADYIEKNL